MKQGLRTLLVAVVVVSSCSKIPDPQTQAGGSKWTSQQIKDAQTTCVGNAQQAQVAGTTAQWAQFCGCVYTAASRYYNYSDFIAKQDAILQALQQVGITDTCLTGAGLNQQ